MSEGKRRRGQSQVFFFRSGVVDGSLKKIRGSRVAGRERGKVGLVRTNVCEALAFYLGGEVREVLGPSRQQERALVVPGLKRRRVSSNALCLRKNRTGERILALLRLEVAVCPGRP